MGKKNAERNARLEALRREQRRQERRRSWLLYGSASVVLLAVLAGIIYAVRDNQSKDETRKVGYVAAASGAAATAGCTGVVNDASRGNTHVAANETVNYDVAPPSSGNHDADPLPDAYRFYERIPKLRIERAVHNLEHGFVIGWYDPKLPDDQVTALRAAAENAGERFIALPWERGDFPEDKHFVLTAWDRTQRCATVSESVIKEFVSTYANPDPAGAAWDSPTAAESGASGGSLNLSPTIAGTVAALTAQAQATPGGTTPAPGTSAAPDPTVPR
ncbi:MULTISPECIES: DUF3105 domain-containing protein [Protofrankia]|uniref:DUF3105 domain-containing protein n=1 Tax=Protofrankia coriariae TaxID=1562887 RepID=A0ABR5F5P8_9ACTN|nr:MULTISPECIES: DUF3105 domain-containing protein [Protofrankia]KLL12054.1 hypothetical protein FrCorBMG51_07280 [Protofrankia coriariae]ONH35344.1 hypothetical protein BL254_11760 [Protofrankia sp. BMG5.30]